MQFVSFVLDDVQKTWATQLRAARATSTRSSCCSAAAPSRAAASGRPRSVRSIARATRRSTSTSVLRRAAAALRRARRLRAGVRDRARDRPSRAEPARHRRSACSRRRERAARREQRSRSGSSSRRTVSPACGRTRPSSASIARSRATSTKRCSAAAAIGDDRLQQQSTGHVVPETLHARLVGAARQLVPARPATRATGGLRHLRCRRAVTSPRRGSSLVARRRSAQENLAYGVARFLVADISCWQPYSTAAHGRAMSVGRGFE